MPLGDSLPEPWWQYGSSLREDRLPSANYIDKSGTQPICRVRPLAERMLEELHRRGRLDVRSERQVFTIRAKQDPRTSDYRWRVAIFQGALQREPYAPIEDAELLRWLGRLEPVLRLCSPPRGRMTETVSRRRIEAIVWEHLHPDFRGTLNGRRAVLRITDRGTELCPLVELEDAELRVRVPVDRLSARERGFVRRYFAEKET